MAGIRSSPPRRLPPLLPSLPKSRQTASNGKLSCPYFLRFNARRQSSIADMNQPLSKGPRCRPTRRIPSEWRRESRCAASWFLGLVFKEPEEPKPIFRRFRALGRDGRRGPSERSPRRGQGEYVNGFCLRERFDFIGECPVFSMEKAGKISCRQLAKKTEI